MRPVDPGTMILRKTTEATREAAVLRDSRGSLLLFGPRDKAVRIGFQIGDALLRSKLHGVVGRGLSRLD